MRSEIDAEHGRLQDREVVAVGGDDDDVLARVLRLGDREQLAFGRLIWVEKVWCGGFFDGDEGDDESCVGLRGETARKHNAQQNNRRTRAPGGRARARRRRSRSACRRSFAAAAGRRRARRARGPGHMDALWFRCRCFVVFSSPFVLIAVFLVGMRASSARRFVQP